MYTTRFGKPLNQIYSVKDWLDYGLFFLAGIFRQAGKKGADGG